jgi:glycerophosphoryl diester phosphodiesterase
MEKAGASLPRPTIFAHRGARGHAPENTLLAFSLALDLGADAIEFDVQRSSDGQLIVIHDGTVDRTTDGHGAVRETPLERLRALDAGIAWKTPQRIPTLAETFALVQARDGAMNLEVKAESREDALVTAALIESALADLDEPMRERLLVSSFELDAVAGLKSRLPWLRGGTLFAGTHWRKEDMIARALELGAEAIHPGIRLVTSDLVDRAHDAGLRVNVWTANRWTTIRKLLLIGVDGIFSDAPERVVIERARFVARDGVRSGSNAIRRENPA